MDDIYAIKKADIANDILSGNYAEAHKKSVELMRSEPDNIDFVVFAAYSAVYGNLFEGALKHLSQIDHWIKNNDFDIKEANSLGLTNIDIIGLYAHSYFGAKHYETARKKLDEVRNLNNGQLPDDLKSLAVKIESNLNGHAAAAKLANELAVGNNSNTDPNFRLIRASACLSAISEIVDISSSPADMDVSTAKQITDYLVGLVECFEECNENALSEDEALMYKAGKQWLFGAAFVLFQGNSYKAIGRFEMELSSNYDGAEACLKALHKLSDIKNPDAQYLLGNIYSKGVRVPEDQAKAFEYYSTAIENGCIDGYVNLAFYYNEGKVVPKDDNKALEYAKKAVENGEKRALALLGQIYLNSFNDIDNGCLWLKKAATLGDENAKSLLRSCLDKCVQNYDEKINYIRRINEDTARNIDTYADQTSVGRQYVNYYMEIEKFLVTLDERLSFMAFCMDTQPELFITDGGYFSIDYFIGQMEMYIEECVDTDRRMMFIGICAKRSKALMGWEMFGALAAGNFDVESYAWGKVCKCIYNNMSKWGWDGYLDDGEKWSYEPTSNTRASVDNSSPQVHQPVSSQPTGSTGGDSYSNQTSTNSTSTGYCYVATAVYGSYDCPEVWTLRRFRDYKLALTKCGRAFIKAYYTISPICLKLFGNTKWFKALFKSVLDRFVNKLHKRGYGDTPYYDR